MVEPHSIPIDCIHVPVKRRKTLKPELVEKLAESILERGLDEAIQVRVDGDRFVLVEGLHRLEAAKALGETSIRAVELAGVRAQDRPVPSYEAEAHAQREKMERLKKLRLEQSAKASAYGPNGPSQGRAAPSQSARSGGSAKQEPSARPRTLADWIVRQRDAGGRF